MKSITVKVPNDFNLFLFGDSHEGSALRHDAGWRQLINMMLSDYGGLSERCNYGVDHGDIIEAILVDDKRYEESTTKESSILAQLSNATKQRKDITKKLITILDGNHTDKLKKFGALVSDVCERLEVTFGTYSCVITYETEKGEHLFKHYAHHGFGSIRSGAHPHQRRDANRKLALRNKFSEKFGDCLLSSMGHSHQLIIVSPIPQPYMSTDKSGKLKMKYTKPSKRSGYIDPDHRWYVNTGSFYKAYMPDVSSYVEIAGYNPVELGFAVARIRDGNIVGIDKIIVD